MREEREREKRRQNVSLLARLRFPTVIVRGRPLPAA